jgi:hypothetical protein
MAKDILSIFDFLVGDGPLETVAAGARNSANGSDKFTGKNVFKAVVLRSVSGMDATPKELENMVGSENGDQSSNTHYGAYYVKITEDSPHSYLPDPCFQGEADTLKSGRNQLIQAMYTTALSDQQLYPGNEVMVRLQKKYFSYDTFCESPSDAYNSSTIKTFPLGSSNLDSLPGYVNISVLAGQDVTLQMTEFMNQLTRLIPESEVAQLVVTSGYRPPPRQAQAMMDWGGGRCKGNVPTGVPNKTDPCRPNYNLYGGRAEITAALKVDWSVPGALAKELQRQQDSGMYISRHMSGRGIDFRTKTLTKEQIEIVKQAVVSLGGRANFEGDPQHLHVGIPAGFAGTAVAVAAVEDTSEQSS